MRVGEALTACELAILEALAGRAWVDAETLNARTADASVRYDRAAPLRSKGCLHVHVFNIREKLGDGAVIHMPDRGYMLGAPGVRYWKAHQAAIAAFEAAA